MPKLQFSSNGQTLAARIDKDFHYLVEKEMRGVVAKGANAIRDQAIQNANAAGLNQAGTVTDERGRTWERQGKIPEAIRARVLPNQGAMTRAIIYILRTQQTYHAGFVEFGTINMAPRPFFRQSLGQAKGAAMAAMQARFDEAVGRMLK